MAATPNTATAIFAYLQRGRSLTTAATARKFGITRDGARARFSELRKAGYPVYANKKNGSTVYRIGAPTRRQLVAGALVLSDPYFAAVLGPQIDKNLSLV